MSETIQIQADWGQTDSTQIDFIKNKPVFYEEWWGTQADYDAILVKDPNKIYNIKTPEVLPNYFYIEDISGADNTVSITKSDASAPDVTVYYSTNTNNWTLMGTTSTTAITATVPANGKLYLKCTATKWGSGDSVYNTITASGNHNVGGNIMSLVYGDDFDGQTTFPANSAWCLSSLFRNSTNLTSAANLQLPATTLVDRCYQYMFEGCTSLTTPPTDLPATTLTSTCYAHMFLDCTSLTTTPALPATTLADNCYNVMFYGCTALTTAPALPATTLAYGCYFQMFKDCSSLNSVTTYAQDISATNCLTSWLQNVAATGTFYNLGGATYTSGASGIPTGWTEHNSL